MTFKKMKKMVGRSGFSLTEKDDKFCLTDRKSGSTEEYDSLEQMEPDVDEILQGFAPF